MSRRPWTLVAFCLVLLSPAAGAELRVGLATVDLTPKRAVPLAGYGSRFGKLSRGVHDPVKVRALYLTDGKERLVWAVLDLIGISAEFRDDVLAALPRELGLGKRNLLLCATHNHSGPGGMTKHLYFQIATGFFDAKLYRAMIDGTARAIRQAVAAARPARIGFGRVRAEKLSRNRRIRGGPTDPELAMLKVTAPDGTLRAVLANFAAHPTILPGSSMQVSAGYPGAFCDALERRFPGAVAIFTNGAEGDQSPAASGGRDRFERAKGYGELLARKVGDALAGIETKAELPLEIRYTEPKLPLTFATVLGRERAPLHRIRLGRTVLLSIPGEPCVSIGLLLKKEARALGLEPWVVGLAGDHLGYIVDRQLYCGAGYESMMNFFGPEMERWLLQHLLLDLLPVARQQAFAAERDPQKLMAGARRAAREGLIECSLGGSPYQLGFQHGSLLAQEIKAVLAGVAKLLPDRLRPLLVKSKKVPQPIKFLLLPRFRELTLPALCLASRGMHRFVPPEQIDEMLGLAHGAGVAYEQIFLLNVLPTLIEHPDPESLLQGALGCTNAVLLGAQAVHGRNLDWGLLKGVLAGREVVFRLRPRGGQSILSLSYPGMIGVFSAVNGAGLSFGWESVPAPKDSRIDGTSVLLLLRQAAQQATTLEHAVGLLSRARGTLGYHYTICDGKTARVLERSATRTLQREPAGGLLLGSLPARATPTGKLRYAHLSKTLAGQPARAETLLRLLGDQQGGVNNGETLHRAVLLPGQRRMLVVRGRVVPFALEEQPAAITRKPAVAPPAYAKGHDVAPARALFDVPDAHFEVKKTLLARFPYRRYRVSFPSPYTSPHPVNNTVYGFHYVPLSRSRGAVVLLPIWKGPDIKLEQAVAGYLVLMGYQVFIMPQAYQFERSPQGVRSGDYTISADLVRTRNSFIQTVQDARRAATWLQRDEGARHLAIMGISLGGVMSSLAYSIDRRFEAGIFILAGGDLGSLFFESKETRKIRRKADSDRLSVDQVRHALRAIEPLSYADRSRGPGVMMINGSKDTSILPANARKLAAGFGVEPYWIPTGHYDGWTHILRMLRKSAQHLERRFGAASK